MNKVASLGVDNSINAQTTQFGSLLRKYTKISWENGLMIMTYLNPTQILSETDSSKLPVAPPNPAHTLPRYQRAEACAAFAFGLMIDIVLKWVDTTDYSRKLLPAQHASVSVERGYEQEEEGLNKTSYFWCKLGASCYICSTRYY